jgi:hypothetical protein
MNFLQFNIIVVCIGYAKELDACLWYWKHSSYPRFSLTIVTTKKDLETLKVVQKYMSDLSASYVLVENNWHNKGSAIQSGLSLLKAEPESYIILSDADILFPENFLNRLNLSLLEQEGIRSSMREDLDELDLELFFREYAGKPTDWAWKCLKRQILSPSPFMGWFLAFPYSVTSKIDFQVEHQGYDVVDWKVYGQLKSLGLKEKPLYLDNPPLHLYHGEKGKNWKGVEL